MFIFGLFLLPLFLGVWVIGFNLVRSIQVTEVCRDAGHMYSRGADFSSSGYRAVLGRLATGLNLDVVGTSGNGVLILSTITKVSSDDCTYSGLTSTSGGTCTNYEAVVFMNQIVVGNPNVKGSSQIGLVNPSWLDSKGDLLATGTNGYLVNTTLQVASPPAGLTLADGEVAYVAEMWYRQPSQANWSGQVVTPVIGARSIF